MTMGLRGIFLSVAAAVVLAGCTASAPQIKGGNNAVRVAKSDPGPGYIELGPVSGEHGGGCGLYGVRGTYDGATAIVKNQALEMGGDYVQIVDVAPPHMAGVCRVNTFRVSGTVFRRKDGTLPKGTADTTLPTKTTNNAERLRAVSDLYRDGLITEEEYRTQRQAILSEGL